MDVGVAPEDPAREIASGIGGIMFLTWIHPLQTLPGGEGILRKHGPRIEQNPSKAEDAYRFARVRAYAKSTGLPVNDSTRGNIMPLLMFPLCAMARIRPPVLSS